MSYISTLLRKNVVDQAKNHCEYCGLSQEGQAATFHIDHIIPISENGQTEMNNLALACVACSLHKAARLTAVDPETNQEVPLYNPRKQNWTDHFSWNGVRVVGLTATGRATSTLLRMNRPVILAIRKEEILLDRHPPLI